MTKEIPPLLIRDIDAGNFIENLLVSAVSSVLIVRVYLGLTGYPQVGGGGIHVAHVIWGGILMAISLIMLLSFLNRQIKTIAAVLGGIGFGFFIDELGKFLTHDNNYFFQPTIALIYVVFVLLFFISRFIDKFYPVSSTEYIANALDLVKEIIIQDMDTQEKKRTLTYLKQSNSLNPLVKILKNFIQQVDVLPPKKPNIINKLKDSIYFEYKRVTKNKFFATSIILFFIFYSIINFFPLIYSVAKNPDFAQWGYFLSSSLSLLVVFVGVYFMRRRKKYIAYSAFKGAVLITILLTQFFLFFKQELTAIFGLVFNLLVYNALQFMVWQEKTKKGYKEKLDPLDRELFN